MTTLAETEDLFDEQKAEAFGGHMVAILNYGALNIPISLGHQTGLFDAMAELPPSTSEEIAAAAGLDERYVREWLGAMVTGKIVEYDGETKRYVLPPEHAPFVSRAGGVDNLAFFTQYLALIGNVERRLVDAFRNGGGVAYEHYPDFQRLQAEETARVFDAKLVGTILPLVPGLVERLGEGIQVADVGCGAGHAINVMAKAFPKSSFTGYDFSSDGIALGRAEARKVGLENARFELRDVATLEAEGAYDLVTAFDAIHDQVRPREVLRRIARALRPGGLFLMADMKASSDLAKNVDHPFGPLLFTYSVAHCMTVSLAHGGEGLGAMWGEEKALELLREAGFTTVDVREIEGDPLNSYYIARR
ncbi:MAG: class I SAM-dependent methyltransferase [Thermoanaerobaculia bacterium]